MQNGVLSTLRRVSLTCLSLALVAGCASTPETPDTSTAAPTGTDEHIFLSDSIEKNYDPHVIMKRAEAFFEREDHPEAIVEYQHFLDMHRTHVLAPYAQFKLGESHFKMAKSVDRDPEPIKKALDEFDKLLRAYPGSKY
jgi:outer membrane protein assembly factor BamD